MYLLVIKSADIPYYIWFHAWNNLMSEANSKDKRTLQIRKPQCQVPCFRLSRCDKEPPDDLYKYTYGQQPPNKTCV